MPFFFGLLFVLLWSVPTWAACTTAQLKSALTNELPTPPSPLGLAPFTQAATRNDAELVVRMNKVRSGAFYEQDVGVIPAYIVVGAFDPIEYAALGATKYQALGPILAAGQVDLKNVNVRTILAGIFAPNQPTRPALIALTKRPGSYAEVVCGHAVTLEDITTALGALP